MGWLHNLRMLDESRLGVLGRRLARLRVKTLHDAGVPVGVLVAPIIPALNEKDVEGIIERGAARLEIHHPDRHGGGAQR